MALVSCTPTVVDTWISAQAEALFYGATFLWGGAFVLALCICVISGGRRVVAVVYGVLSVLPLVLFALFFWAMARYVCVLGISENCVRLFRLSGLSLLLMVVSHVLMPVGVRRVRRLVISVLAAAFGICAIFSFAVCSMDGPPYAVEHRNYERDMSDTVPAQPLYGLPILLFGLPDEY